MKTTESIYPTGDHRNVEPHGGISLREHFAGLAMQGMMANVNYNPNVQFAEYVAGMSVAAADLLISELNKETP